MLCTSAFVSENMLYFSHTTLSSVYDMILSIYKPPCSLLKSSVNSFCCSSFSFLQFRPNVRLVKLGEIKNIIQNYHAPNTVVFVPCRINLPSMRSMYRILLISTSPLSRVWAAKKDSKKIDSIAAKTELPWQFHG